jgi:2-oxoglutarate ferredoxin oxidoreductase subunit beta
MMDEDPYALENPQTAWCPGCGNFAILDIVKQALSELGIPPQMTVIVSGIGQAAKMPQYLRCNMFNGLHGRALPVATAIKASNPQLTVLAESGDGDTYGEGGNHFMHAIRRNPSITNIVHNNMVYGLTKGQASPTSQIGFLTPIQVNGVTAEPFNPLAVAISLGASFVARAYCQDATRTKEILKLALNHRGYALVDILQPCVTFNKVNTYRWFKERTYYLEESHDQSNRLEAFRRATEYERLPLGIFYRITDRIPFEDTLHTYEGDKRPLYQRKPNMEKIDGIVNLGK